MKGEGHNSWIVSSAIALKEHTNGDLPHSRLEASCTPCLKRDLHEVCTSGGWPAFHLALGISERRLTQSQAPPRFLSVPSALTPKGPRASTAFSSVLLWTSGIVSRSSSSWSSSTFQPLKEPLKQAVP